MEVMHMEFFGSLFEQNANALLSLPTEVKTILVVALIICIVTSILKKAFQFLKVVVLVAIAYFVLTAAGVI